MAQDRVTSQQHVSAAVVRPKHEVDGKPYFLPPPESMSLEISKPKIAQVITLPTLTRVQNLVMIAQPQFPPRIGENANPNSSFPFLLYSCSCVALKRLDRFHV